MEYTGQWSHNALTILGWLPVTIASSPHNTTTDSVYCYCMHFTVYTDKHFIEQSLELAFHGDFLTLHPIPYNMESIQRTFPVTVFSAHFYTVVP